MYVKPKSRVPRIAAAAAIAIAAIAAIVWWATRPSSALKEVASKYPQQLDLAYQLPGSPLGMASNGEELLIGNRSGPWSVLRVRRDDDELLSETVTIEHHGRPITLWSLAWNGASYVGLADEAWFRRGAKGVVFTVHDPKTLAITAVRHAPPHIGCLAWDGRQYWAATRRNTRDSPEPALLYRIDRNFEVVSTSPAPAVGCQGLAWDGEHLWLADVFSDAMFLLDGPTVVRSAATPLDYLSGVAQFEDAMWLIDYGDNRLHRVSTAARTAWMRGDYDEEEEAEEEEPEPVAFASAVNKTPERKLTDKYKNTSPKRAKDDAEVLSWSVTIRDDALYASWSLWFGEELFTRGEQTQTIVTLPQFARYEVTVTYPDGEKTEQTFEAGVGENIEREVHLADTIAPGEYAVSIFIHVQYVSAEGTAKILNRSGTSLRVRK